MYRESSVIRWRKYDKRYRFEGKKCKNCEKIYYPIKTICECSSKEFEKVELKGVGELITFTKVTSPPEKFTNQSPYCVGIVKLVEGPTITTQLTDCSLEDLKIGMKVESVFKKFYTSGKKGIIHYGTKFRPIF